MDLDTVAFPLDPNEKTNVLLAPPTVVPAGATFAGVGAANLPVHQLIHMPGDDNACALATMCAALSSELERRPANERNPETLAEGAVERARCLLGITAEKEGGPGIDATMSRILAGSTSLCTSPSVDVARGTVIAFAQALLEQAHVGIIGPSDTPVGNTTGITCCARERTTSTSANCMGPRWPL